MTVIIQWLFWLTLGGVVYVYAGYPAIAFAYSRLKGRIVRKGPEEPRVSIIIAAHNEESHIAQTLENKLSLDYPADRLQVVVVSDGSTDGTDAIVREYAARRVILVRQEPRNGKTAALNTALRQATGDVVVFADANSLYASTALRHLVSNFADPEVGYVTGKLTYLNPDGTMTGDGCTTYMRYENFIRSCETRIGSLVGVNGGIDAVRRVLYEPMQPDDLPDLVLPLRVVARGYRVVYEPRAVVSEFANENPRDEYRMRVRVALRALWTMAEMPGMFNLFRHGFYSLQLFSHKALRYVAFGLMAATFVSAALLWTASPVYSVALVLQAAFGLLALLGYVAERARRRSRVLSIPYYFLLVNAAALQAFIKFLKGERARVWNPRLG